MKRLIIIVLAIATLTACGPSREDKALELVKGMIQPSLYHPDSYKSVSISVDSAFNTPYNNGEVMERVQQFVNLTAKMDDLSSEVDRTKRSFNIWNDSFGRSYASAQYTDAKEKYEQACSNLERATNTLIELYNDIRATADELDESEFCGWIIRHRFTSLNGAGSMTLQGDYTCFADIDMAECNGIETDDYVDFCKILRMILDSEDMADFVNKCQTAALLD